MRQAIAWSYEVLSPEQQTLLRRLSVFVGGCSLESVEPLLLDTGADAATALESLVDKHLVMVEDTPNGQVRCPDCSKRSATSGSKSCSPGVSGSHAETRTLAGPSSWSSGWLRPCSAALSRPG